MKDRNRPSIRDLVLFKPDLRTIIIMCLCAFYNVAGLFLARHFHLPFWLDNVGTMAVSIKFGPLAGVITAAVSQPIYGIPMHLPLPYYLIGIMMALIVGFFFPRKHREDTLAIVTAGVFAALVTSMISFPLNLVYNDGYTQNIWGDSLFRLLTQRVSLKGLNAYLSVAFIDLPDRVLTVLAALFLVDIEETRIEKKKQRTVTRTMTVILALIMAGSFLTASIRSLRAVDFDSDYDTITYGTKDGILTAEVNAVAQTRDGFIWIGTYSGLYKYNGIKFVSADIDDRIRNVMNLFVDSNGRLWIGTNDSGVFCYDPSTRNTDSYDAGHGLASNSLRSICEDKDGNIYLGTVMAVSKIGTNGTIKSFKEWGDITYCTSFISMEDGSVLGVTNTGIFFMIKDDMLIDTALYQHSENIHYKAVASDGTTILVTTTEDEIARFKIANGKLSYQDSFTVPKHSGFTNIKYSSLYKGYFYCGDVGFGFIDAKDYKSTDMTEERFRDTISDVCVDDQGNIWFASSKHGLLKCSHTPFRNLYKKVGIKSNIVNAVYESDGLLYVGTDYGMVIIDLQTNQTVSRSWLGFLEDDRIRHIMKDSKGNLWISTYGSEGMVMIDTKGLIRTFNEVNGGTLGSSMRSSLELSDGRILFASNMGLTFLDGDKVVATLGEQDGLHNQYILSMYEREDGSILAASDGDGIYIIKNDHIAGHISAPEGLESSVVMRIVKGTSGYFYVTSNALYYDDGTTIRALKNFPYSNNYDILISDDGVCWVVSSAGLFVVDEKTLIEDGEYTCTLLNKNWGLNTTFTANAWNIISGGSLYLCCTDGVRCLSTDDYFNKRSDYHIQLESIRSGDEVYPDEDGVFKIPPEAGRITINIAITNYSLTNPLVHYYLEGSEDSGITCYQSDLSPLEFNQLPYGSYKLHIQVLNEISGEIEHEEVFSIRKDAMMYEKLYFRIYLFFVAAMVAFYIVWLFFAINKRARKIRGLQKEMSTDPMTGLYNKAASERILTRICSEETGTLMMIDLDSFKLVNDIYGHDMGDRILIRFAELITEAVGEGNMGGRLGGDEFIGFIKGVIDEEDIAKVTSFLNREIVKSAKEYMGNDMNIPLGASVGAVRVPVEGKSFDKLFRYADKALYIVKQNGKHGYAFYQKGSDNKDLNAGETDNNDLLQIKKIIGERNEGKGAYLVNFDKLQVIYKFLNRNNKVTNNQSGFIRITIESPDETKVSDEVKDSFEEVLITNLKKNDVVSRYSGRFFVIFTGGESKNYREITDRIISLWKESGDYEKYNVTVEVESVG